MHEHVCLGISEVPYMHACSQKTVSRCLPTCGTNWCDCFGSEQLLVLEDGADKNHGERNAILLSNASPSTDHQILSV